MPDAELHDIVSDFANERPCSICFSARHLKKYFLSSAAFHFSSENKAIIFGQAGFSATEEFPAKIHPKSITFNLSSGA